MKTVSLLLLLMVCVLHSAAMRLPARGKDDYHRHHLANVIDLVARTSNSTLNETLLQTFVLDITHLTRTVSQCKTFLCQAHSILAPLLGDAHLLVRNLKLFSQHQNVAECQVKETANQTQLRKLLEDMKVCAQRILSQHHG